MTSLFGRPDIRLAHEFVEFIPEQLEERVVYVSIKYATVVHKCCCGCGNEVVTPLSPTDWQLIFDGTSVSLDPSIGSWNLACRSHYWITNNTARWSGPWSKRRIEAARRQDVAAKAAYFARRKMQDD
jgi:hypothetical protein